MDNFLFVFMSIDLHAPPELCGTSVLAQVAPEIPLFQCAPRLLKTLGHEGMILLSTFFFAVRCYAYTLLTPSTVW